MRLNGKTSVLNAFSFFDGVLIKVLFKKYALSLKKVQYVKYDALD